MRKALLVICLVLLTGCVNSEGSAETQLSESSAESTVGETTTPEETQETEEEIKYSESIENSSKYNFENTVYGKYAINNLILNYNSIAEFPLSDDKIAEIKDIGRPIGKIALTIDNGAYVIISYNDYSNTIFLDYQDEAYDDEAIFCAFRDFSKALNRFITDEDIALAREELCTGEYGDYYGNQYDLSGIKTNYSKNVLKDGKTRFLIKCSYKHRNYNNLN